MVQQEAATTLSEPLSCTALAHIVSSICIAAEDKHVFVHCALCSERLSSDNICIHIRHLLDLI